MQKGMSCEDGNLIDLRPTLRNRMEKAFGGVILNTDGGDSDDKWFCRWKQLVSLFSNLYDLPGGNVGKDFVGLLADEISMLTEKRVNSERFIIFCRVVLQRDRMVKKGDDVCLLLKRRIDAGRNENFDELVQEAIRCGRQSVRRRKETLHSGFDHVVQVFTRLMLRGEVRAAVRWIIERGSYGVLLPTDLVDGSTDKTVIDVLKEKHPDPGMTDVSVCLEDDNLPVLMDVDVTGGHIERLARTLHGGAGPGGTTSNHWQSFLLCYGTQSAKLRDAIAALTCLLANSTVNWDMIRAMLSSRLIALNKNPGIRPIGVREVLRRLLGKAMVLATGIDIEELCGADQLCSGLKGGIKGAIYSVWSIFESKSHEGYVWCSYGQC